MRASLNRSKDSAKSPEPHRGLGVDYRGELAFDPSQNVQDLNEASGRRQDDLREATNRLYDARIAHIEDMMILRADYQARLEVAESKRIDAIRAVDVNAVAVERQRSSDQASVLATQVQQSAEALRSLVATTQASVAQAQQQIANTLSARITTLEQAQYEGKGKQLVADPMMEKMVNRMDSVLEKMAVGSGQGEGLNMGWKILIAGVALLATLSSLGVFGKSSPPAPTQPQIIYVPAPAGVNPSPSVVDQKANK